MDIGVLALQGDFREHLSMLESVGTKARPVKSKEDILNIDALVIPGGESTTICKLAKAFDLFEAIKNRISQGMPTYGSCAGMILVSDSIVDPASGQETFGGINMVVRRNAFGKQVDSFESDLDFAGIGGEPVRAVFIRAPWVESFGNEVNVLASVDFHGETHPVAVSQNNVLATSFHPEITGDGRVHQYFVQEFCKN